MNQKEPVVRLTSGRSRVREKQRARRHSIALEHIKSGYNSVSKLMVAMSITENIAQRIINELLAEKKITAIAWLKTGVEYALSVGNGPVNDKFAAIFHAIRQVIEASDGPVSEAELAKALGLSSHAIRAALATMVENGELDLTSKTLMVPRLVRAWTLKHAGTPDPDRR